MMLQSAMKQNKHKKSLLTVLQYAIHSLHIAIHDINIYREHMLNIVHVSTKYVHNV